MARIYIPARGPEDWKQLLADPEKQWKQGYSARSLAHCWQEADGFPAPVGAMIEECLGPAEMLIAVPEYQVPLPGGAHPSQNDLFVLAKTPMDLVSIMVEGKVSEPFARTVAEWLEGASAGKQERLAYLCARLGKTQQEVMDARYQLLHRTVSALDEAKRFGASVAVMLVHSFSPSHEWFADFAAFALLFGIEAKIDRLAWAAQVDGVELYLGWAHGDEVYLQR
jgi:hypothetical protein